VIRTRILLLLLICILALTAIYGCLPMGSNQPRIPAVWVSAIAVPDYSINESQIEAQPGGVPFRIILYVEPLQLKDLNADMQGQWQSEDLAELLPPVGPVMTEFGFFSDGLGYPDDIYTNVAGEDASGTVKEESVSGDDVSFEYAVWTQVLPSETYNMAQRRVWYKSFTINSDEASFIADIDSLAQMDLQEDLQTGIASPPTVDFAQDRKTNFQSNRYRVQFWFVQDSTEATPGSDPIALIPETVTIPISPLVTINRVDPETDIIPSEVVVDQNELINFWDLQDMPVGVSLHLTPEEGISAFATDRDIAVDNGRLYNDYFAASAAIPAEAESYEAAALNYGFGIANFVDEDPEGSDCDEDPEVGSFGFVSDGLCFSSVYGIPIDRDSLFYPHEAHIVELPYTFWLVVEPSPEYPPDYFETEPYDLKVIIVPAMGGEVQMSTAEGVKPYDKGPEGTWQSSMAYNWFIDQPREVTLTAIPSEGYRFVAWETDDFHTEIEDPSSPVLKLNITPPLKLSDMWRTTTVRAYFALLIEEPQDEPIPTVQETIDVSFEGGGQCTATQSMCSCNLSISVEGKDLTGGSYPVTNVTLTVNGDVWDDSGSISETQYTKTVERTVDCDMTFNIEVTATNSIGQTRSRTGSVSTAR